MVREWGRAWGKTEDFLQKEVSEKIVALALPISSPSLRSYYNSTGIRTVFLMMVGLNDFKTLQWCESGKYLVETAPQIWISMFPGLVIDVRTVLFGTRHVCCWTRSLGDCVTFILYYNSINELGDVAASPLIKERLHSPLGRGSGNACKALWSQSAAFPAFLVMVLWRAGGLIGSSFETREWVTRK